MYFYLFLRITRIILRGIDYRVESKNVEVTTNQQAAAARPGQAGRGRRPSCIHGAWLHAGYTRAGTVRQNEPLYYRCITISNYYLNLSALC